ncbi:aspartate kinase [candidate division KSB3 bacterium]|uniref:aspartate kinase n=1 Tax=candidate division KSB3 bacterium TaxID=2044937 RepID=A0A2G6E133_9BACT|nr:MAG: aspartate kinase [candidate division KSB3 bacterium]PIE30344.1 MAG: aspartate kinase [candidate division KSB3 bacterium]
MLTVEKIGGTSMSKFHHVLRNIVLVDRGTGYYNRIFVVSAYAGVTNLLLEHKKTGVPGIYEKFVKHEDYNQALEDLLVHLLEINTRFQDINLDLEAAETYIAKRIEQTRNYLDSMTDVLASGYVDKHNILLAARELLASVGEAHSAFNSANIISNHGLNVVCIDLSGFHDSRYFTIDRRIQHSLQGLDFSKTLAVVTGYTKGTEGIMREFDRGYSEVTFSKIAVEVGADEAVIHKEFHLSSADPHIVGVENAVPVCFTNYDVADQLADIGMEAIHPKASKPLEQAGISIRVKNTFEPEHPGTLISKDYVGHEAAIEIVAGTKKVVIVEVHDPLMVGEVGFDLNIMTVFASHQISYILKSTNANSISMVIWEKDLKETMIAELRSQYQRVTVKEVAVVCVIGSNIAKPGVLAKATHALAQNKVNINCVAQSLRQINMQFVIERESFQKAIVALNNALCVVRCRTSARDLISDAPAIFGDCPACPVPALQNRDERPWLSRCRRPARVVDGFR